MSVEIDEELAGEVDRAVANGHYASSSQAVDDAIRYWRSAREMKLAELRRLIQEGLDSGEPQAVDDAWFESIIARGKARLAERDV